MLDIQFSSSIYDKVPTVTIFLQILCLQLCKNLFSKVPKLAVGLPSLISCIVGTEVSIQE